MHSLKCTQMRARVEKVDVLVWNKSKGHLRQLPRNAPDKEIFSADGANLKQDNQKNGWKGVCVYQEHNGDEKFSLV